MRWRADFKASWKIEDMKTRFLTGLYGIEISGDLGRGDKIQSTMLMTNNRSIIKNLVPKPFIAMMGKLEYDYFSNAPIVVYSNDELPDNYSAKDYLVDKIFLMQSFLNSIWLFHDNNINNECAFLIYGDNIDSNFIASKYFTSSCKELILTLSRDELRENRNFFRSYIAPAQFGKDQITQSYKGVHRIARASLYVDAARTSHDLAEKIAYYCSALEALFSTSTAELSHQLAERVACFVGNNPEARVAIYRTVKKAYGVRSVIVHGATLRKKMVNELVDLSPEIDQLVRLCMFQAYGDPDISKILTSSQENLDEYMIKRIFGL